MNVEIKKFDVEMLVKNSGIELEIKDTNGDHLGDLAITKSKVVWCKGKTKVENGISITWKKFIEMMESE